MNLSKLSAGKNPAKGEVLVVVEIPEGAFIKYEVDKDTELVMVDRFAYTTMAFPANYGFIPGTHGEDGDPLDALVITPQPLHPGVGIEARIIGMLEMEDEAGVDTKIIALPSKKADPFHAHIDSVDQLDEIVKKKIKHYFDHYKDLESNKWVKTKDFLGVDAALEVVQRSLVK